MPFGQLDGVALLLSIASAWSLAVPSSSPLSRRFEIEPRGGIVDQFSVNAAPAYVNAAEIASSSSSPRAALSNHSRLDFLAASSPSSGQRINSSAADVDVDSNESAAAAGDVEIRLPVPHHEATIKGGAARVGWAVRMVNRTLGVDLRRSKVKVVSRDHGDGGDDDDDNDKYEKKDRPVDWVVLSLFTVVMIAFDYAFVQSLESSPRAKAICIIFWVGTGCSFCIYTWIRNGFSYAAYWMNGYLLEYTMSFDNLFVFSIIFKCFRTPEASMHKALFVGVWSVIFFRLIFFIVLGPAMEHYDWVNYALGSFLVVQGLIGFWDDDADMDDAEAIKSSITVRCVKGILGNRLLEGYDSQNHGLFMYDSEGRLRATMLMLVVVVIELSDILFALDSASTKVVVMPSTLAAYSSTVMACLGLRSLYFVLHDSVAEFVFLKYGIAFSLLFIGFTLFAEEFMEFERWVICVVATTLIIGSIILSILFPLEDATKKVEEDVSEERPPKDTLCSCMCALFNIGKS